MGTGPGGPMKIGIWCVTALCLTMTAWFVSMPTFAAPADDNQICSQTSGDVAIAACTRAIKSGRFKGNDLARLYVDRGSVYGAKGDTDKAIADFNEAIRLDPTFGPAYYNRA